MPQLRLALCGWLSKELQDLDGKASLHDHAWAPYAVSPKDWHAAVAQAQECHSKGELFGKPAAAAPAEEPLLGDAAAPAAGAAAPAATTGPVMPSATELSYLRLLAGLLVALQDVPWEDGQEVQSEEKEVEW